MPESVSISVNGQSRVPPGFRFHPTEEELLQYYLRKKVASEKIDLDVIVEVDLNKLEPWDIQERCKIGSTPQNDWYFFSHKDKKYPTGTRTNRATMAGFWKATGRDKIIYGNGSRIGMRKTLVFYKGRAPHGLKSDWIMHEYRLDDNGTTVMNIGEAGQEEGWVVCRIFKKKNLVKPLGRGSNTPLASNSTMISSEYTESPSNVQPSALSPSYSSDEGSLDKIFLPHMGGNPTATATEATKNDEIDVVFNNRKLPGLESPMTNPYNFATDSEIPSSGGPPSNWVTIDRMLAAHLNGQQHPPPLPPPPPMSEYDQQESEMGMERSSSLNSLSTQGYYVGMGAQDYYSSGEVDLWSLISRSSLSSSTSDHLM